MESGGYPIIDHGDQNREYSLWINEYPALCYNLTRKNNTNYLEAPSAPVLG